MTSCGSHDVTHRGVVLREATAMLPPWSPSLELGARDYLIRLYFAAGHKYRTILQFLHVVHGIKLSMRHLKRVLKSLGLRRRAPRNASSLRLVSRLIQVRVIVIYRAQV